MAYELSPSVPEDKERICQLFLTMLRSIYHREDVTGYALEDLDRFYTGGEDWICVARDGGRIVGFLSIECHRETQPPFLYLDDFSVEDKYRGQGIGTAMLAEAERYAATRDVHALVLHV